MDEEIKMAIKKLAGEPQAQTLVCEVVSVDWDKRECHVKHDSGIELFHCRLRAVIEDNAQTGLCLKPKVNSLVTVQLIEMQNTAAQVIGYSEVDAIELKMQDIQMTIENGKLKVQANEIEFNGGNLGGMCKKDAVAQKLSALEQKHDGLANYLGALPIPVSGSVSGAAVPANVQGFLVNTYTQGSDLENTKIKQ